MTNSKSTKRAFVTSALAVIMCVAMLIGTTFAWFTDTASTSVNKIQAGKLDLELQMMDSTGNWVNAEGTTLNFKKAAGHEAEEILWEPGCTYELPEIRVINKGNLALDYKIVIAGLSGDAKLLEAITFTGADSLDVKKQLLPGENSGSIKLVGTMKKEAGNEYQGLSADGIYITVYAIQSAYEHDSNDNQYDAGADMTPDNLDLLMVDGVAYGDMGSAIKAVSDGGTITFCKSTTEPITLTLTEPTAIKNVTFSALPGVEVKGLRLISAKSATRLELDEITFKGITFTDAVKLGQDKVSYGPSKCANITFENCKFDLTNSNDAATSRYAIKRSSAKGADESIGYTNGLTVRNCEFNNVASGIFVSMMRDVTVENCTFTNCTGYAIRFGEVVGKVNIIGNKIDKAKGALSIGTVANNNNTANIETDMIIKDNVATDMSCNNGEVFFTTYDNGKTAGKTTYTVTGNSVTYTNTYETPLNGFQIMKDYGSSVKEFIPNV